MVFANSRRWLVAFAVSAGMLAGCGGGDDDGGRFAGQYAVTVYKVSDTCYSTLPYALSFTQTVQQSGQSITVVSNDITLNGSVDADGAGFTTTYSNSSGGSAAVVYRANASEQEYTVGFAIGATAGSLSCVVAYGGTATRQ